ncbi:radical SAM protein [candidate division KSB1 bacterium]|nr:radical SAM protein [candidate division KSB1 bacterium]
MHPARKIANYPLLLVSDGHGHVFEIPELYLAGMYLDAPQVPERETLIPMPAGSALMELPGRWPMGYDPVKKKIRTVKAFQGQPVIAVAAFMAPAHTQIYRAAYMAQTDAVRLPLFAYTAVGWYQNDFWVTGLRVDPDPRHDQVNFNMVVIGQQARLKLQKYPHNRLVTHLVENCVWRNACQCAQNWVLDRWEAPVPISPACNAQCLGCISQQPDQAVPVTQERITFIPTPAEILEYTVPHLNTAPAAIISFGQGCEGEPLVQGDLLATVIREIHQRTDRGTIHLNTNAGYPDVVARVCEAGLDSIRISLNSAQPDLYQQYYSPVDYDFQAVLESLRLARHYQRWISLNYFIFPGLTDAPGEMAALIDLLRKYRIDFIQMRNLNIDPEWYQTTLGLRSTTEPIGILNWMQVIRQKVPWIRFGYFNPPKESWKK